MIGKSVSSLGRWAVAAAMSAATLAIAPAAQAQEKVLRAVLHADVRVLDPFWTTQTIAAIHGMLVYDTLFGNDEDVRPKPQMVDTYDISADRKTYTFTLRAGLKFHDGSPVTTKDVIASLRRWGAATASASVCSASPRSSKPSTTRRSASSCASRTAWCSNRSARP